MQYITSFPLLFLLIRVQIQVYEPIAEVHLEPSRTSMLEVLLWKYLRVRNHTLIQKTIFSTSPWNLLYSVFWVEGVSLKLSKIQVIEEALVFWEWEWTRFTKVQWAVIGGLLLKLKLLDFCSQEQNLILFNSPIVQVEVQWNTLLPLILCLEFLSGTACRDFWFLQEVKSII